MTDQLTPQTQRQHFIAQDAGNAAYSAARKRGDRSGKCYAAYRTAYQASLAEQQAAQVSAAEVAEMEAKSAEQASDGPDNPGMWK